MVLQFAGHLRPLLCQQADLDHFELSTYILKFLARKAAINQSTSQTYKVILRSFAAFVRQKQKLEVDTLIDSGKKGSLNPYDLISEYGLFITKSQQKTGISPNTIRNFSVVVKKFLRVSGVKID